MAVKNTESNNGVLAILGTLAVVLFVLAFITLSAIGSYNSLVSAAQEADSQWGNVEASYQRRYDLIPNLVETVKGYMKYEGSTLEAVTTARSAWANAKTGEEKIAAGTQMDSVISRLLLVVESYPQLKASESTNKLMDEVAGTENRISVERMRYNDAARNYNMKIKYFPTSIIANMAGFKEKPYFDAVSAATEAPKISFD